MRQQIKAVALAAMLMTAAFSAQAAIVSGSVWIVDEAIAADAVPANVPATTPDVTFSAPSDPLFFTVDDSPTASLADFLASGGAFDIVENTAGALASDANNTLWRFTGFVTVTDGQVFSVGHDDGLTLIIGGVDLGFDPGPTAPIVSDATYTGPSGTFPFLLIYGECCAGPGLLLVDLPFETSTPAPAPAPLLLLLTGLAALGIARRR